MLCRLELSFDDSTSKAEVLAVIDGIEYMKGNTRTGQALIFLDKVFDDNDRSEPNFKRVSNSCYLLYANFSARKLVNERNSVENSQSNELRIVCSVMLLSAVRRWLEILML